MLHLLRIIKNGKIVRAIQYQGLIKHHLANIAVISPVLPEKKLRHHEFLQEKSPKEKLQARYKRLMEESYKLSHTNRKASDDKAAEADAILKEMEALKE